MIKRNKWLILLLIVFAFLVTAWMFVTVAPEWFCEGEGVTAFGRFMCDLSR